jgi:hypothetical protein
MATIVRVTDEDTREDLAETLGILNSALADLLAKPPAY